MVLIWVPSWPCTMIGGFLFGPVLGFGYSLIGSTAGAVAAYGLARTGLAHRVSRRYALVRRLHDGFARDALQYVIVLRLIPVMPFGIIHVAAAMFRVPLGTFVLGTVIGMIPCIAIYAVLGAQLDRIAAEGGHVNAATFLDVHVWGPLLALAALALAPTVVRWLRKR
jgi:uncharacterized membrane protein YdjX (TVP38/TMEM64 family)